jgi:hypothetical protein
MAVLGMLLGALLIASVMANLEWSAAELSTLRILERARAQEQVKALALAKLSKRMTHLLTRYRRSRRGRNPSDGIILSDSAASGQPLYNTGFAGLWEGAKGVLHWMGIKGGIGTKSTHELTTQLRELQHFLARDLRDLQADEIKFDRLYHRCKYMEQAAQSIHDRLEQDDFVDSLLENAQRRRAMRKVKLGQKGHEKSFDGMLLNMEKDAKQGVTFQDGTAQPKEKKGLDSAKLNSLWMKAQRVKNELKRAARGSDQISDIVRLHRDAEKGKVLAVLERMSAHRPWTRNKDAISKSIFVANALLAGIAFLGTCLSLGQNEMVVMGYGTVALLDLLKTINSVCSILCVVLLFFIYLMRQLLKRVNSVLRLHYNFILLGIASPYVLFITRKHA